MTDTGRRYFHGGPDGLRPGVRLRPSGKVVRSPFTGHPNRPDRIYVTTEEQVAFNYTARCHGNGAVYEVRPLGELKEDPGTPDRPGLAYEARSALVVRRIGPGLSRAQALERETVYAAITAAAKEIGIKTHAEYVEFCRELDRDPEALALVVADYRFEARARRAA